MANYETWPPIGFGRRRDKAAERKVIVETEVDRRELERDMRETVERRLGPIVSMATHLRIMVERYKSLGGDENTVNMFSDASNEFLSAVQIVRAICGIKEPEEL